VNRLVWVLAASAAIKLVVLLTLYASDPSRIVGIDTASYENPARALLATGHFSSRPEEPSRVETLVPPGYPLFLASVYAVTGNSRLAAAIGQIAVSTATIALTFVLARRLWDISTAQLAAILLALDPLSFAFAFILHTETVFSCALLVAAIAGLAWMRTAATRHAFFFGLTAAVATLIRPIAYYLFPLAFIFMCARVARRQRVRPLIVAVCLAMLPWIAVVEAWSFRNYVLAGRWEVSRIASVNLAWFRGVGIIAKRDGISFWDAREKMARALPDTTGWPVGEVSALYRREGLKLIRAHPVLFAANEAFGLVKVLAGPGRADLLHFFGGVPYERTPSGAIDVSLETLRERFTISGWQAIPVVYSAAYLLALYALVLAGVSAIRHADASTYGDHAFLLWIVAYLVIVAAGPEAYARFRVPVMPVLAVYGARGWSLFVAQRLQRIQPGGTARGQVAREGGNGRQHERDGSERRHVERVDADEQR
jgi:4-amino-4-deoxy-L-arabinose transferase-like glycosyltransferase